MAESSPKVCKGQMTLGDSPDLIHGLVVNHSSKLSSPRHEGGDACLLLSNMLLPVVKLCGGEGRPFALSSLDGLNATLNSTQPTHLWNGHPLTWVDNGTMEGRSKIMLPPHTFEMRALAELTQRLEFLLDMRKLRPSFENRIYWSTRDDSLCPHKKEWRRAIIGSIFSHIKEWSLSSPLQND